MKSLHRLLAVASAAFFFASAALAQTSGTVTNHAFAVGKGIGQTGYTSLLCGAAQLAVGQTAADPICRTVTGDVTIGADGVTAIGNDKVAVAMIADAELKAIAGLTSANNKCFYWTGTGTSATFDCSSFGRSVANVADAAALRTLSASVIGTDVQAFDSDLSALAANSTSGFWARTGAGTGAARTLTAPAAGFTITNPAGTAGDPTFVLANDLSALEGLASTGFAARTASDTWAQRSLAAPAAGFTITNPAGIAGNPTFVLANDLAALEGLGSSGCAARTAADTWAVRTITGTTNQITVTNGDCVSGNPTISIPSNAALPGSPTTTTQAASDNSTKIATTAYVDAQVAGGVAGVASIAGNTGAFTLGTGLTNSTNDLRVALPYFSASLSANQTVTSGVAAKILFNTELADSNGWYDNATNYRFTPLVAGKYRIHAHVAAGGTTVTEAYVDIYKNGSTYSRSYNVRSGTAAATQIDQIVAFNGSTDYVEIFAVLTGTGTVVASGGSGPIRSWFEATFIGP